MADKLYFSRDAKVYAELTGNDGSFQGLWEIPVLDGFSFSQSTNQTEIGLTEMESTAGISRRGRRLFTDSLSPAEWSFSTYMRPTKRASTGTDANKMHLVDQVLWAAMAGADAYGTDAVTGNNVTVGDYIRASTSNPVAGVGSNSGLVYDEVGATLPSGGTGGQLGFQNSNRSTLPKLTLYFVFETDTTNPMVYKLSSAIVNECSIDFDIDGIATANWSGFAKEIEDMQSASKVITQGTTPSVDSDKVFLNSSDDFVLSVPIDANNGTSPPTYDAFRVAVRAGVTSTNNFIRNRLTQLQVRGNNRDVLPGVSATISGITNATAGVITTSAAHNLKVNDPVFITGVVDDDGGSGDLAGLFNVTAGLFVKTVPSATTFTVSSTEGGTAIDTTNKDAYASGGTITTGVYNFTLTGGNVTISNNVTYLVPEEIGTINKPVEGVTGARAIGGNFTCYLTFDSDGNGTGSSADFFADLVNADAGLTKVVNEFDVTFKVGGTTDGEPRVNFNFPKVHIDVPAHSIEDVISLETNFGAYTSDFDTVDEFNLEVFGVTA